MEPTAIIRDLTALPPDVQRQVADFVAFLKERYISASQTKKLKPGQLADEPFIGMWRARDDMRDSGQWVRELRRREWEPGQ